VADDTVHVSIIPYSRIEELNEKQGNLGNVSPKEILALLQAHPNVKFSILDFKSFQDYEEVHSMDGIQRRDFLGFVSQRRLEFIYTEPAKLMDSRMMVENVVEQHQTDTQYLKYIFGDRYNPRVAWTQRDTSGTYASLDMLAALGYDVVIFAKKDIDESFYDYITTQKNTTHFRHHRTGTTVILAPERPTVFEFDCQYVDGLWKSEAELQKIAKRFYKEHVLPAI